MNEQIFKLAQQANLIGDWGEDITKGRYFVFDNLKSLENFAELIVRECANVAADHDALDIYEEIRQHFGVEE
jgi:hypothetical protein